MADMKVGVVGYGYTGRLHAQAYESFPRTRPVAVADSNEANLQAVPANIKTYNNYTDLLASDLDAVSICLPTCLHCEATLAALARGKHVLVEKPIAVDQKEASAMLEAARAAGRTLFVGMTHRFYPELRQAKQLIDEGAIGQIVFCNDSILEHFGFLQSPPWYLDKKLAGGGTALTSGIHLVDRLRWFTGDEVTAVSGASGNPYFHGSVDDAGQMFLRFRSGISAQITMAFMKNEHPLVCDLQVVGTEGSITVHTWRGYELHNAGGSVNKVIYTDEPHPLKVLVGVIGEVEEFYNSIRENRPPRPSAEESTRALEIVTAYYRAARRGTVVSV